MYPVSYTHLAWESYKKDVFQGNEELLEGFEGNNPLKESDSYEITLKEVKSYKQVVSHLETIDGCLLYTSRRIFCI